MLGFDALATLPLDSLPDDTSSAVRRRPVSALSNILKQSTAANIEIVMLDSTDHVTGKASLTLTITLGKDGAAQSSISPTVTDRGTGIYKIALTSSHTDTLNEGMLYITGTGADPQWVKFKVIAQNLENATPDVNVSTVANNAITETSIHEAVKRKLFGRILETTASIDNGGAGGVGRITFLDASVIEESADWLNGMIVRVYGSAASPPSYSLGGSSDPSLDTINMITAYDTGERFICRKPWPAAAIGGPNVAVLIERFSGELETESLASTPPTAAAVADAVWDETRTDHVTTGSFGENLNNSGQGIIRRATAQTGSTASTLKLDASASAVDDFYNRRTVVIVGGTGVDQARLIYDYVGSTKVASVTPDWTTTPDNTSVFVIFSTAGVHLQTISGTAGQPTVTSTSTNGFIPSDTYQWRGAALNDLLFGANTGLPSADVINGGQATAGGASTITLGTSTYGLIATSTVNSFYNGTRILLIAGTGAGQERIITGYVGATKVATVDSAWVTNPDNTTRYAILAGGRNVTDVAPTTPPTAAAVADAVWDELRSDHVGAGSFGEYTLADAVKISGDATAADALESQYDGTGLDGDLYPARQDQVRNIAVTSAALNTIAASRTITTGTETGTIANATQDDGTYWSIADVAGTTDVFAEFDVSATTNAVGVGAYWKGYLAGAANTMKVFARNWAGFGSWDQIGTINGIAGTTEQTEEFELTAAHTSAGLVRIRFSNTGLSFSSLKTDRLLLGYVVTPATSSAPSAAAIADAVWDETNSDHLTAGTTGKKLSDLSASGGPTAADIADAVWDESMTAHLTAGTAGASVTTTVTEGAMLLGLNNGSGPYIDAFAFFEPGLTDNLFVIELKGPQRASSGVGDQEYFVDISSGAVSRQLKASPSPSGANVSLYTWIISISGTEAEGFNHSGGGSADTTDVGTGVLRITHPNSVYTRYITYRKDRVMNVYSEGFYDANLYDFTSQGPDTNAAVYDVDRKLAKVPSTGEDRNILASSQTINIGTETGTLVNTEHDDGVNYWQLNPDTGDIEATVDFDFSGLNRATGIALLLKGVNYTDVDAKFYFRNWSGAAWDQVGLMPALRSTNDEAQVLQATDAHSGNDLLRLRVVVTGASSGWFSIGYMALGVTLPENTNDIADSVWEEDMSVHTTANTAGSMLSFAYDNINSASIAWPIKIEVPSVGTRTYRIEVQYYDIAGEPGGVSPGPTIAVVDQAGTSLNARLDSTTMSAVGSPPGLYRTIYTSTAGDAAAELNWTISGFGCSGSTDVRHFVSVVEGSVTVDTAAIADAVWDEARAGHTTAGTFGEGVNLSATALAAARDELLDYIHDDTGAVDATVRGLLIRIEAFIANKMTGGNGPTGRLYKRDGTTIAVEQALDPTAGTRGVGDISGSE